MAFITTVHMQYSQVVYGEASFEVDVDKVERDYGPIGSITAEQWRDIATGAEAYAPKSGDGLIEYDTSYVESEEFTDFSVDEVSDTLAPDTVAEARGDA